MPFSQDRFHWLSVPACLSVRAFQRTRVDVHGCTNVASAWSARATWRSMKPVIAKWEPQCLLLGRSCRGGLVWLLYWAAAIKSLAVKGETH